MNRSDEEKEREKKLWDEEQILTFHHLKDNFGGGNTWKKYIKYIEYQYFIAAVNDLNEDIRNLGVFIEQNLTFEELELRRVEWETFDTRPNKEYQERQRRWQRNPPPWPKYTDFEGKNIHTVATAINKVVDYYIVINQYNFGFTRFESFSKRINEKYQVDGKLPYEWEKESEYIKEEIRTNKQVMGVFKKVFEFVSPGVLIRSYLKQLKDIGVAYVKDYNNPSADVQEEYIQIYDELQKEITEFTTDKFQDVDTVQIDYNDFKDKILKKKAEEDAKKAAEEKARKEAAARKAAEEDAKKAAEEKARKEAAARKAAEAERKRLEILQKQKELCDETNNSINNMISLIDITKKKVEDLTKQSSQCRAEYNNKCRQEQHNNEIANNRILYDALGKEINETEVKDNYQKCSVMSPCELETHSTEDLKKDISIREFIYKDCVNGYEKQCACLVEGLEDSQAHVKKKMQKTDKLIESYANICTNRKVNKNIEHNIEKNRNAKNIFYDKLGTSDGVHIEDREILKNIALTTFASIALYYLFFEV